jgi:hypothetical protein
VHCLDFPITGIVWPKISVDRMKNLLHHFPINIQGISVDRMRDLLHYFPMNVQTRNLFQAAFMQEEHEYTTYHWWRRDRWFYYEGDLWYIYRGHYVPFYVPNVLVLPAVTSIRDNAFHDCRYLKYIFVPDSVLEIGHHAFNICTEMTTIRMPTLLTRIEVGLFHGCKRLQYFALPNTLRDICRLAFAGCSSLSRINIPPSVTRIGSQAFEGCSKLTSVAIPRGASLLCYKVFHQCCTLEVVELPIYIQALGWKIFSGCYSLRTITLLDPNSITNSSDDNMFFILDCKFRSSSEGRKTIRMPNISSLSLWPQLLQQLDQHGFFSHIGVSKIGRKTAMFSFLQQNMCYILKVRQVH